MTTAERTIQDERLSELVTQLTGAPLDRSREAIRDVATRRTGIPDELQELAEALVQIRSIPND